MSLMRISAVHVGLVRIQRMDSVLVAIGRTTQANQTKIHARTNYDRPNLLLHRLRQRCEMKITVMSLYTFKQLISLLKARTVHQDSYGYYFGESRKK